MIIIRRTLLLVFSLSLALCSYGHLTNEEETDQTTADEENEVKMEKNTHTIDDLVAKAEMVDKFGMISKKDTEILGLDKSLDDVIHSIKDKASAHKFATARNIPKVIIVSLNLGIYNPEIIAKVLTLLKVLFEFVPVTTNAVIPKSLVYKLLDIFENYDNLALKAHALDVLYKWLPNNPEIQMRVMKAKGLEPFYSQINTLDISVIHKLLDLFNIVLKEHVEARSENAQVTKSDYGRLVIYERIGLLERMETPNVCNGLVNIFQVVWAHNNNGEIVKIVLELIKNTKPFCADILKGKPKAIAMFETVRNYLKNEAKKPFFEDIELNLTDFEAVIEDYVDKVKAKDEF